MRYYVHSCSGTDPEYQEICAFAAHEYQERYGVVLTSFPDMFIYVTYQNKIVGCFGAYHGARHHTLTTEWYIPESRLSQFLGGDPASAQRTSLYEVGTRVVRLPSRSSTNSVRVSVAMAAALLGRLAQYGGHHALFTADRSVRVIARQLRVVLTPFGIPDLSARSRSYQQHWRAYFAVPRECFGFDLDQAAPGCDRAIMRFQNKDFVFDRTLLPVHAQLADVTQ